MREYPYKALSVASDVREIINTLKKNGFLGYVVGGAVRDLLLGIPVSDWDLATDATPGQLIKIFPKVTMRASVDWSDRASHEISRRI